MSRTPLWTAIAEDLRSAIAAGRYREGMQLPTEAELSARFGVNRHTVRRALAELGHEGLVISRRGAGVFVAGKPPLDYAIGRRVRFHANLASEGRVSSRKVLALTERHADAAEARALGIAEGAPVHVREGVSFADDQPLAVYRSVFPGERLPGIGAALARGTSVTEALAECGVGDYLRVETRLTAKRANAFQALHLMIREGDPILRTISINADASGAPVEYGHTWFAGDRVTLTVTPD
ncbi:phosphonate metabolism transcriptional regulator PhnF [Cereibacter sp. SYSU M97828]|nr:phosphonate metabolism transcriptional regulator PhnF [Cereibacter flavus]